MKTTAKKSLLVLSLSLMIWASMGQVAWAGLWDLGTFDFVVAILSNLMQMFLTAAAWLVGLTGTLLNVAMFLTTHLGAFINDTPVVYTVWAIIRDLSSVVLIFFILWAAIQMILGLQPANFGSLIKSIVIMGILINFSFFFARVLIDASNIVSLQFFNAISPGKEYVPGSGISDWTLSAYQKGGLSDIFMGSLKVNEWYKNNGQLGTGVGNGTAADPEGAPIRIILITIGGVIVMILASMSFLGAAAACIFRVAMLIFLLIFSPIWIAARALPQIQEHTRDWWNQFKAQLLFLPVYLLFMYVAIRILTESNLQKLTSSSSDFLSQGNLVEYISLFVGFAIVIIMINLPLLAAVKIAGAGSKMTESWFNSARSFLGARTFGRMAYGVNESGAMARLSSISPTLGTFASGRLSKVSGAGFGVKKGGSYEDRLKAKKKEAEAMHKKIVDIDRSKYATEGEYQDALNKRRKYQERYRGNLSWKGPIGGIIGFMLDNRANRQTAFSLTDEANLKKNKAARDELDRQISELERSMRITQTDEEKSRMRELIEDRQEVNEAIGRAEGAKKKKDISSLAQAVAEEVKDEKGGGPTPPAPPAGTVTT